MPDLQTELKKVKIALKPMPLTERVWRYLKDNGPKTRKQLIAALGTTTGSMSRTVWVLKVEGYIKSEIVGKGLKGEERLSLVSMTKPWTGCVTPKKGTASTLPSPVPKFPQPYLYNGAAAGGAGGSPPGLGGGLTGAGKVTAVTPLALPVKQNSTTGPDIENMTVAEAHALYVKLYKYFGHNHA